MAEPTLGITNNNKNVIESTKKSKMTQEAYKQVPSSLFNISQTWQQSKFPSYFTSPDYYNAGLTTFEDAVKDLHVSPFDCLVGKAMQQMKEEMNIPPFSSPEINKAFNLLTKPAATIDWSQYQ